MEQVEIKLKNICIDYELYYDKTNNLKEYVANLFRKSKYVEKKKDKLRALNNLTINFDHGERVGIVGKNGAGKSTLLKVLSGILKPSAGRIDMHGSVQPLIEIGAGFDPEFSGRENIYLNGYMLGFSHAQIKEKEKEIIEFSGLSEFIDVPVKYYSSGMSVRLAFTIATSIEPEILIFDEMLAAGDIDFINKAKVRMQSLIDQAKILIIASHDLGMILELCQRVIVLQKGDIVFDGNPRQGIDIYMASGSGETV